MRIVADRGILSLDSQFGALGELHKISGREISQPDLLNADALLVRSITRVDEQLLHNTSVKFVGSATSGTDHIDLDYLQENNIRFVDAKGSNAQAVVEFCFAALARLSVTENLNFFEKTFALIGAGCVGGLYAEYLRKLGIKCLICDPLLASSRQRELEALGCQFVTLSQALSSDVVSIHTSLTSTGLHPTYHLLDRDKFNSLAPGVVILNAARGEVINNAALVETLKLRNDLRVVLDVWENEPDINSELLGLVTLASPHIAGYSAEAKSGATQRLRQGLVEFLGVDSKQYMKATTSPASELLLKSSGIKSTDTFCDHVLRQAIDIEMISKQFRKSFENRPASAAELFDSIRQSLVNRHEFTRYRVQSDGLSERQKHFLSVLGFVL